MNSTKPPTNTIGLCLHTVDNNGPMQQTNSDGSNQLLPQIETHVEPYELVELFYGNQHPPTNRIIQPPSSESSSVDIPAEVILSKKTLLSYKCDFCSRVFKEASHFSKHKRGGLCQKRAKNMAKKTKKQKDSKGKEIQNKKAASLSTIHKPYRCNICGAKFFDKVNVELHLERSHQTHQQLWTEITKSENGLICSECDLWIADKVQLKEHQNQHTSGHAMDKFQQHTNSNIMQQPIMPSQFCSQPITVMSPPFPSNSHPHLYHQLPPSQPLYQVPVPSQQLTGGQNLPLTPVFLNSCSPHTINAVHTLNQHQGSVHTLNQPQGSVHTLNQAQGPSNFVNFPNNVITTSAPIQFSSQSVTYSKQTKSLKPEKMVSTSKWNMCGECGLKFVDPINLEFHLKRKHPASNVTEMVELSGVVLYRTNNINGNIDQMDKAKSGEYAVHTGKPDSLFEMPRHFQNESEKGVGVSAQQRHLQNENESGTGVSAPRSKKQKGQKCSKKSSKSFDLKESEKIYTCDLCDKNFSSKAEMVRHRVKDKNILCGICSFSSCSNMQVVKHMASHNEGEHSSNEILPKIPNEQPEGFVTDQNIPPGEQVMSDDSNFVPRDTSLNKNAEPSRLYCCMCDFCADSGVSLAQHLESHGSVHVKCSKCGESNSSFIDLNNHINSSHSGEVIRVTLTMTASHTPSVYMFLIVPKKSTNTSVYNSGDKADKNELGEYSSPEKCSKNNFEISQASKIYACSDCGACLTGDYQLETHLLFHQNSAGSASVCPERSVNLPSNYHDSSSSPQSPLLHTQNTVEFRCEECGFWREQSDSVIRHIQSVHMSAKMVHSQRQTSGQITGLVINVFSPLSAMVSS